MKKIITIVFLLLSVNVYAGEEGKVFTDEDLNNYSSKPMAAPDENIVRKYDQQKRDQEQQERELKQKEEEQRQIDESIEKQNKLEERKARAAERQAEALEKANQDKERERIDRMFNHRR